MKVWALLDQQLSNIQLAHGASGCKLLSKLDFLTAKVTVHKHHLSDKGSKGP